MIESVFLALFMMFSPALASDLASLRVDRAAIERVYYNHRTGQKLPFEQALPAAVLENLVQLDLKKEAALKQVYKVEVTKAMLDAEVKRIDTTTRAPDILAEIKKALGNDASRFANSFAKPIVVERLLRERFDNDDALHAAQRRRAEQARNDLLSAKQSGAPYDKMLALLKRGNPGAVSETTWQFGEPPAQPSTPGADQIEIQKRFGPNAQILSPPHAGGKDAKFYFADLPPELQNVLRVQMRAAGDVSAVIETPAAFLLYVAKQRTDSVLSVAALSLPKRSYEKWLEEQPAVR
jgi:hypothetical protein